MKDHAVVPRLLGGLVGLLGLAFVGRLVWTQRAELADTLVRIEVIWLVPALVLGIAGMSTIGWAWQGWVLRMGGRIALASALRAYFVGQLGKYVPGGVWAVVGRGEWARRAGVPRSSAYTSTMLSMGTAYVAGALVAALALLAQVGDPAGFAPGWLVLGVAALGPMGLLALHPGVMKWLAAAARRLSRGVVDVQAPSWGESAVMVARQLPAWLGIGGATWLLSVGLGADLDFLRVLLATCVSWVAGFLFLFVPGGIGIREAAFVGVLGQDPVVATVALAARLLFVVVDVTGAAGASLVASRIDARVPRGVG